MICILHAFPVGNLFNLKTRFVVTSNNLAMIGKVGPGGLDVIEDINPGRDGAEVEVGLLH